MSAHLTNIAAHPPRADAAAAALRRAELPVAIVAGTDDRIVGQADQSARLGREIGRGDARLVTGAAHMVHYAQADAVVEAVSRLVRRDPASGSAEQLH